MNVTSIGHALAKNIGLLKIALTNCNRLNYCSTALVDLDRSRDEVLAVTNNINRIFNTISLGRDTWTKAELIDLFNREMLVNTVQEYNIWVDMNGAGGWALYGTNTGTSFEAACEGFFKDHVVSFDKVAMTVDGHAVKQYPGDDS